ncbi:MAG: recombinase family protein [Actinomycetota bacterium]|nr:recombinase family protein [Actinomycetota bacterium]
MPELTKVLPTHLRREAWVYVRQSTMTQVRQHTESLARQYELADRARSLGWPAEQVHIIDEDLGRSGAEASARTGFQSLVAAVGLAQVGLVLGIEVSRLARNNADWYHLLDLCSLTDTLIADNDGLYHPADYNDRLVLGLKGTMSEAELHLLRSRLDAGLRHKAARGELRQGLPVGLDYDEDGRVVLSPDEAVREAIAVVFRRFEELGSARQALMSLRTDGLRLPRRSAGSRQIRWAEGTYPAVHDFLTNPAYAGAFVFGRTKVRKHVGEGGVVVKRECDLPIEEWEICIPEHHPGYVSWDAYLANRKRLRANWRSPSSEGGGAAREGRALLQGLVRCGRCGRKMTVGYSGDGSSTRYVCARGLHLYGSTRMCQSVGGRRIDGLVIEEAFALLEPAAVEATIAALGEAEAHHVRRLRVFELAVERAGYDAERARRQFDAVEPENRLVARSLEREWEQRLSIMRQAEADLAVQRSRRSATLRAEEVEWLSHAGADLRAVFEAPSTTARERKQLLRTLISEVVVSVDTEAHLATGSIVWEGGATTDISVALPRRGRDNARTTAAETVELVRRLAVHYDDVAIARLLARQGCATATGLPFTKERVSQLRRSYEISGPQSSDDTPVGHDVEVVSVAQAEELLGTSRATLYRWLADGFIAGERDAPGAPWRIRVDASLRAKIAGEIPPGWVDLAAAAVALGVSRQSVLDRIQRGELKAVHVNRGRRKGLAIEVPPPQAALFAGTV